MSPAVTRRRLLAALGGLTAAGVGGWAALARLPREEPSERPVAQPTTPPPATESSTSITSTTTTIPETTTTEAAIELQIICRAAWGAVEPDRDMVAHTITRLTLHHTATPLSDNSDAPSRARAHQRFHLDSGFADLAYHFLVDREGNVLEGRSVAYAGETFTAYDPIGHFLVCCEGNYDEQEPTPAQLESVARLFAWGASTHGVDVSTLSGHRDHAATTCPGAGLYATLEDGTLAAAIEALSGRRLEAVPVCGPTGEQAVAAIESA